MISSKDISVVVQGAITEDTKHVLRNLRKLLKDSEIILSTYKNSPIDKLDYDIIIENDDPGCTSADLNNTRYDNTNRQIVTTKAGIKKATKKYILKTRTDVYIKSNKFLKYFDKFSKIKNSEYKVFNKKVLTINVFSRSYMKGNTKKGYKTPFHISDWFHFGLAEDIKKIWLDLPLQKQPEFSRYFEDKPIRQEYAAHTRTWRFPAEQYIFYNLFSKINPKIYMENMLDYNDNIIKLSENYIKHNFIIIRTQATSIEHKKYNLKENENQWEGLLKTDEFLIDKIKFFIMNPFEILKNKREEPTILFFSDIQNITIEFFKFNCNDFIDEELFLKLLKSLKQINYSKKISLLSYEKSSNSELIEKRTKQITEYIPNAVTEIQTSQDLTNNFTADANNNIFVNSNGDISPYHNLKYIVGNIKKESILEIYNNKKMQNIRKKINKKHKR